MAQTLPVYAVAALLLVASSGPALQAVRDASLADFEALDEWRSLDEFPFLQEVRPYLPPLVVDWIIVNREHPQNLPVGVDYRLDKDGRVILIWPDGCEESQTQYQRDSKCAPGPDDPCVADPSAPECAPPEPPECPPGEVLDPDWPDADPACIPDPDCTPDDNGSVPARCPAPPPPPPNCRNATIEAYDGSCIPTTPSLLRTWTFPPDRDVNSDHVALKVPYANLSLEISWTGLTNPGWTIRIHGQESTFCFKRSDGGLDDGNGCEPQRQAGIIPSQEGSASYNTTPTPPSPVQNLTIEIEYEPDPAQSTTLEIRLYGRPHEATDATTDE